MSTSVAVIGCGYWGRNLVRVFHDIGALAAVCDADADLATEFAEKYSVPERTLEDLFAAVAGASTSSGCHAFRHQSLARSGRCKVMPRGFGTCTRTL